MDYVTWFVAIALGIICISYVIDAIKFRYPPVLIKAAGVLFAGITVIALEIEVSYLAILATIMGILLLAYFQSQYQAEWQRRRSISTKPAKTNK